MNVSCVSCHKHFSGYSEADFVAKGYIVPGAAFQSKLYARLIGSGETIDGTPDMPKTGDPLTADQLQAIQAWINGVVPSPAPNNSPSPIPSSSAK